MNEWNALLGVSIGVFAVLAGLFCRLVLGRGTHYAILGGALLAVLSLVL